MMSIVRAGMCLSLAALPVAAQADKFCFIVAGDGRADNRTKRAEDENGVNKTITSEIRDAVLNEKAKFLMWTGDLVLGYAKDPAEFEGQLMTWRGIMEPLYTKKIPILACRGNHDASSTDAWKVWNKVFTGKYAMPMNGPDAEKGMTFAFTRGPVLALGLDQYQQKGESVDQTWLDGILAKNKKPFVFSMGHEPAFMDGAHKDTMDASPEKRDAFWNSLINAGSRVFFCGHDHLYDHMLVVKQGANPGPEMHQIVAGTAGAPFYPEGEYTGNNTGWSLKRLKHIGNTYGYVLVQIDGKKATITFKGRTAPGKYEAMDTFSYTVK